MSSTIKVFLTIWVVAAVAIGISGILAGYPVRVAQAIGATLTLTMILLFSFWKSFQNEVMGWSLRTLTLFQSWRILPGAMFLYYYYSLGQLPFSFAVIGGYGDILVGLTAIPICPLGTADRPRLLKILLAWQFVALFDLVFVIRAAFMANLVDPEIMRPLTQLPLVFLPLILVPMTLFAHFVAITQLIKKLRG